MVMALLVRRFSLSRAGGQRGRGEARGRQKPSRSHSKDCRRRDRRGRARGPHAAGDQVGED